jgi:phosphate starvation-inducible PhoH-like protein
MKDKVDPYLRPLYDALYDMMPAEKVDRMLASGQIEIAPLAFMRGRTLAQSYVIIDEAQNTTPVQMKMVLTRLGDDSRMVITGDLSQVDLPSGQKSGLEDAVSILDNVEGIGIIRLKGTDVVRHPVVARILNAYETRDTKA